MQLSKRVIQLAKDRALYGFSMLAQNIVADAQDAVMQAMTKSRSGDEHRALGNAAHFLRFEKTRFAERIQSFYRDYLDRAMQTMYTDLRAGLRNVSADRLTLIDDETINRQIEVDRLVVRMRDVDSENLGRLNMIVAQLHGDHDVRERENPFRPYLLARSLHEVLASLVRDEAEGKLLFEVLSNAMIQRLPGFYAAIREVFDANGVHSQLLARPSGMSHGQRVLLARRAAESSLIMNTAALGFPGGAQAADDRIFANLQRLQGFQEKSMPQPAAPAPGAESRPAAFQDFIWQVFNHQKPAASPRTPAQAPDASEAGPAGLLRALGALQKEHAENAGAPDEEGLQALREKIDSARLDDTQRIAIDVVSLLFEFMAADELVPARIRKELARLRIPCVKAVMLTPELLQQQQHPARRFLNRIGTLAAAIDAQPAPDRKIETAIADAVSGLLGRFEQDMGAFARATEELDQAVCDLFEGGRQASMRACIDALEDAESFSVVLFNTAGTLKDLLPGLNLDPRVSGFITQVWVRVLARLFCQGSGRQDALDATMLAHLRNVLPELVWSAQPKQTAQERSALMRLLPELARRMKAGLAMIGLSEAEARQALDQLVDVHTQVLRGAASPAQPAMSLEELYQYFALLSVCEGSYLWTEDEPLKVQSATVRAACAGRGVAVRLHASDDPIPAMAADAVWLGQMHPGLGVEMKVNGEFAPARLEWASTQRALFMFSLAIDPDPVVYSSLSLLKALRDGSMRMLEYAPLFERAIESLMINAEALAPAQP